MRGLPSAASASLLPIMARTARPDGRSSADLRPLRIERNVIRNVPGSVIIEAGHTRVLCTASIEESVPAWRAGRGVGWLTGEYDMLPAATGQRRPRDRSGKIDGRTQEIQRLIGRCLRAAVSLDQLGERTIWIDADVLQADGGTRTAAITGCWVALVDALRALEKSSRSPRSPDSARPAVTAAQVLRRQVAAVSVGKVDGQVRLDLCYEEDRRAEVDFNVVMTDAGEFIECQGSAEAGTFSRAEMDRMIRTATTGIKALLSAQQGALGGARRSR